MLAYWKFSAKGSDITCTDNCRKLFISGGGRFRFNCTFYDLQNTHKLLILHWLIPSFNVVFFKRT